MDISGTKMANILYQVILCKKRLTSQNLPGHCWNNTATCYRGNEKSARVPLLTHVSRLTTDNCCFSRKKIKRNTCMTLHWHWTKCSLNQFEQEMPLKCFLRYFQTWILIFKFIFFTLLHSAGWPFGNTKQKQRFSSGFFAKGKSSLIFA